MARTIHVPIKGAVLAWAMEEAAVTSRDVASRVGVSTTEVDEWIEGTARPTKTQFKRLATYLRRPTSVFFLPEPPSERGVPPAFRHPPGITGPRDLLVEEARAIRHARRTQKLARWLAERQGKRTIELPHVAGAPEEGAQIATNILDWSLDRQLRAPSSSAVMRELRGQLELEGVLVLHLTMTEAGCRGFSLFDDFKPLIAVNTSYNVPARIYSYLHEFGHLLRRADSICTFTPDSELERWCEQFASAFLLPRQPLELYLARWLSAEEPVESVDEVSRIARRFRVSLRAVAVRLGRIGRAAPGLYARVDAAAEPGRRGGGGGGETRPQRRLRELGVPFTRLVFGAQEAGLLSRYDVLDYLNLPAGQLSELRSMALRGVDLE